MRFILSRSRVTVGLCCGMFSAAPVSSTWLPPQLLPVYGGSGGTAFTRTCGSGKVLTGLRFREGLLVDAVGVLCRPVAANGSLGTQSTVGTLAGGGGGTSGTDSCRAGQVVTGAKIKHGAYVDMIVLYCRTWDPATRKFGGTEVGLGVIGYGSGTGQEDIERCEALGQPVSGIRGRVHDLVDAIGFICNEP